MTPSRRPPARVFWFRRVSVLAIAFLLVFGIARLFNGSSDATSGPDATQAAGSPTAVPTTTPATPGKQKNKKKHKRKPTPSTSPLAMPSGPCAPADVVITPEVRNPIAGSDVIIALTLQTVNTPACTFDVSSRSVTVKLTSGRDDIWSSRECPGVIPVLPTTVRKDVITNIDLTWNAKRSDDDCTKFTDWAMPGWYHVRSAALGGEPVDVQFELVAPTTPTVTQTAEPEKPRAKKFKPRREG